MNSFRFWSLLSLAGLSFQLSQLSALAQANTLLPVVSITATFAETLEPGPTIRVRPGELTLERAGSTNQALLVAIAYSGSATWGTDYEAVRYVSIAAGVRQAVVTVGAIDDLLPEGDETVIATLVAGNTAGVVQNYAIDPAHNQATVVIHDNDAEGLPVVGIRGGSVVLEFCPPNADCASLSLVLRRAGTALDQPLTVFFEVTGTARSGIDYTALPHSVTFAAGQDLATVSSVPIDDQLYEGDETVVVTLVTGLDYLVDPNLPAATTIIRDNEAPVAPVVSLELVHGEAGETLINQNAIFWAEFNVRRTGPTTNDLIVFLDAREGTAAFNVDYRLEPISSAGTVRIPTGFSSIAVRLYPIDDTLVEGTESAVVKLMHPPLATPAGNPVASPYSIDPAHASVAMTIRDNDGEGNIPLVSLSANDSWRTGEPCPVCFVVPGVLTVSRTGPTTASLSVFLTYDGTATAGVDYRALPLVVTIPAGTNSAPLLVLGIDDLLVEGPEVVRARLQPVVTAAGAIFGGYRISEVANEALVVIGDNEGGPALRLDIIEPAQGARITAGTIVKLSALGVWTEGELDHSVEFLSDGVVIGRSNPPSLDRPTIPGLPSVHTSSWTNPPPGDHILTARFAASATLVVTSPPVRISVGGGNNNALPAVAIVRPHNGEAFPAGAPIEIVVETWDPDGYVPQVRFFADGRKIGEANIQFFREPDPGQLETLDFVWKDAPSGRHILTAQAVDNQGGVSTSAAVVIEIGASDLLPVVTVSARDAWAVEPNNNTNVNTATFRLRRSGPTNEPLVVAYALSGTAENGTDYETLENTATIPAGRRSVLVTVRPRLDTLREGMETVVLTLRQANAAGPYVIGRPSVAIAVISDEGASPGWPHCVGLPGGMIHLCFAAEPDQNFRLEASPNLRDWETIGDGLSDDGLWHFVDGEVNVHPHRFYRLTPEPAVEADE